MNLRDYELFIFDCDGTLVDSMPMWGNITYDFADYKGVHAPEGLSTIMNSMSLHQCADYYVNKLGASGTVEEVANEITEFAAEGYRTKVPEKPSAKAFLNFLKENGKHIALATASDISALKPCLERLGMYDFIEYAASCATVGKSKEHPDVYLDCCEHFGIPMEKSIVIEDALYAAKTAKNAGFTLISMADECHPKEDSAELGKISDVYISDFAELMKEGEIK
ncbi:MAG: HAD family phosphatase [Clostridia bacterium]|nr:HAD family phosphatase [Clostridia bacterium]